MAKVLRRLFKYFHFAGIIQDFLRFLEFLAFVYEFTAAFSKDLGFRNKQSLWKTTISVGSLCARSIPLLLTFSDAWAPKDQRNVKLKPNLYLPEKIVLAMVIFKWICIPFSYEINNCSVKEFIRALFLFLSKHIKFWETPFHFGIQRYQHEKYKQYKVLQSWIFSIFFLISFFKLSLLQNSVDWIKLLFSFEANNAFRVLKLD